MSSEEATYQPPEDGPELKPDEPLPVIDLVQLLNWRVLLVSRLIVRLSFLLLFINVTTLSALAL